MTTTPLYVIGAGGHSRSIKALSLHKDFEFQTIAPDGDIQENDFLARKNKEHRLVNGIGFYKNSLEARTNSYLRFLSFGYDFENLIGSSAVTKSELQAKGIQIFELAYVGPNVDIGNNVVINTGVIVEHDCTLMESSFLSPGVRVLGSATVGKQVFIGAGAIIFPGVHIPNESVIPAGSLVKK